MDLPILLRKTPTPMLFEGAMGTSLIARGLPVGAPAERCTIEHPDWVAEVHRGYVSAGVRVLKSNTFNANRARLTQIGKTDRLEELNRRAVELARSAAGEDCAVVGVIGPSGVLLPPAGTGDPANLQEIFAEQAQHLVDAGVDGLLVETMFDLREAQAALAACQGVTDLPVLVTMTFTQTPKGFLTLSGDGAGDAVAALASAGAFAVGANCSLDGATMAALGVTMRRFLPDARLLIAPCAGQPQTFLDALRHPDSPTIFAEQMLRVADAAVEMIGGCCGVHVEHVAALRIALDRRNDAP